MTEQELFVEAFQISDPAARDAYLDRVCADDAALRGRIAGLLGALGRAGGFLEAPAAVAAEPGASRGHGPAVSVEAAGDVVGPYKLLEQIGEGGFGVVFMAEQTRPVRRKVALKVVKPGMDTRQVVARFEAERQALAMMDHPNIAKVHDAGATDAGRPYFAMELVRGVPVTEFCDQNHLAVRDRLLLFVQVCRAVQHAHQKGVIHRDLKPTNVLVTLHDGVPVPKVIDFGIAKATGRPLTDRTLFTNFAQMVGTPLYMSPEQAELSGLDVDTRSDIYALGVLLYELLTGTTPFDKERLKTAGLDEIRRIIREEEPARPSTRISTLGRAAATVSAGRRTDPQGLRRQCRKELDWIVMRCLEKDRNRRYETASALAADVQRYLADEPVQACPPSASYRFGKFARRNRREVMIAGAAAAVAVTGVAGLGVSRALIARALKSATEAKEDLIEALEQARLEAYFQRITVAHRELSIDNLAAALRALRDCPEDLRGWEWHYLMRLFKVGPLVLQDSTGVYGVAFSPDGERLASAGADGSVKVWNSRTGKVTEEFKGHEKAACGVAFHPDGRHLASAGADRLVKVWDLRATGRAVFEEKCDAIRKFGAAYTVAFRPPDGRHLAAGYEQVVKIWDWEAGRLVHSVPGPEYHSIPVAFSRDGRRLATGGPWEQGLNLWDADTGRPLGSLPHDREPASALAFSADGGRLASATLGRNVSLWDAATGALLRSIPHTGNVHGVAVSPDGERLASVGEDKTVHVWDAATGREVLGLYGHTEMCGCVAFSPDGRRLASASNDRTVRVWDATPLRGDEGQEIQSFPQPEEVRSLAVSPDGRRIVSAGQGAYVRVLDAASGATRLDFAGHRIVVFAVAWHADNRRVATAGSDGRQHGVVVWDASDGRADFQIPVGRGSSAGPYQALAFSPDGGYLVTGKLEGKVEVWDARTGARIGLLGAHEREIRALVFSRDGRHLASASGDGTVNLWDAQRLGEKQEPRRTLRARVPGPSVNVAFSPDGRRLATGGDGNTVKIWDAEKGGEALATLQGHTREVYAVAFSPAAERPWVASGGEDSRVNVWDGRTGKLVHSFRGHTGIVSSLAFSPDGRRLYSGCRDKTVKVWDLTRLSQVPDR